jgi:hypothetical protein
MLKLALEGRHAKVTCQDPGIAGGGMPAFGVAFLGG